MRTKCNFICIKYKEYDMDLKSTINHKMWGVKNDVKKIRFFFSKQ